MVDVYIRRESLRARESGVSCYDWEMVVETECAHRFLIMAHADRSQRRSAVPWITETLRVKIVPMVTALVISLSSVARVPPAGR
jgi:hypothetical protein